MSDTFLLFAFFGGATLLIAMRWAHRNWMKAFLATLFAPLVGGPMFFVGMLGFSFILRILNAPFAKMDRGMSSDALGLASASITSAMLLFLLILYLRDQRHLATIETSPGLGIQQTFPEPRLNQKRPLR